MIVRGKTDALRGLIGIACVLVSSSGCRGDRGDGLGTSQQAAVADASAPDDEDGGRIVDDGTGPKKVPNAPITRIAGTGGFRLAEKKLPVVTATPSAPLQPRDRVLAQVAAAAPNDLLSLTLILKDVAANWKSFRDATVDAERSAWIQARNASLLPTRQALINWLSANGAVDVDPFWIANQVHAYVPASKVPALMARQEILDVAPDGTGTDTAAWTGQESTDAVRLSNLAAYGMAGYGGGKLRPRILVAIIEQSPPYRAHAAFSRNWSGGSRIQWVKDCTSGTACPTTSASSTTDTHGNRVAAIAAATIEHGQDPAYPGTGTPSQRRRSGHLRESYLATYLWTQNSVATAARAVQEAIADGADVINISFAAGDGCNRYENAGGMNGALQNALSTGAVVVASAGNGGPGPGCTLGYPSQRPEVFAVNGVDTYNDLFSYTAFPILAGASRGGVLIRTYNGTSAYLGGVSAVVPGNLTNMPSPPGNSYVGGLYGSSAAAPVATGLLGAVRNLFQQQGWVRSSGGMMATALLFGDGWNSDSGAQTASEMSWRSGAGRLRAHWPSSADLVAPYGWGWQAITIYPGQTVTWPVGIPPFSSPTQWKWAVMYPAANLDAVPDVDFYVDDTCAGGGVRASDAGYDVHSRFRFNQSQIAGRCLQMRAYGYSVPSTGVTFYTADYFHSGDTTVH